MLVDWSERYDNFVRYIDKNTYFVLKIKNEELLQQKKLPASRLGRRIKMWSIMTTVNDDTSIQRRQQFCNKRKSMKQEGRTSNRQS